MTTLEGNDGPPAAALRRSAAMMRIVGWGALTLLPAALLLYPPGFLWGTHPDSPHHPPLSPYLYMLMAMYVAWALLMIRGARDPLAHRSIVDYGILANALHGGVMLVEAFAYPHEMQHLWADVPALFALCVVLWIWHPARAARRLDGAPRVQRRGPTAPIDERGAASERSRRPRQGRRIP